MHCSVPGDVLLIRVYGQNTDLLIDRGAELRNIQLLQGVGFAPKLYATFNNGLAYEFVPGSTLDVDTVRDPAVYPLVARRVAQLHAVSAKEALQPDQPRSKPILWDSLSRYLAVIRDAFKDPAKKQRFVEKIGGLELLEKEFEDLQRQLSPLDSPVVMCHNDLLLANIILDPSQSSVTFIDYEYAGLNYQAFDIGNHFAEFAGVSTVDYSLYPDKDLQFKWLEIYLEEYNALQAGLSPPTKVVPKDVEKLYIQVNKFALASHFLWVLWALVQSEHSAIEFEFFEYATIRLKEYHTKKNAFLSLELSS